MTHALPMFSILCNDTCRLSSIPQRPDQPATGAPSHLQVTPIQQAFVLDMVSSATFNKVLAGARECRAMLWREHQLGRDMRQEEASERIHVRGGPLIPAGFF